MAVHSEIPISKHEVQMVPADQLQRILERARRSGYGSQFAAPSLEMVDQLYTQTAPVLDTNTATPARTQQLGR